MGVMCLPEKMYKGQVAKCVAQNECTDMCTGSKGNCEVDPDQVARCGSSKCKDNPMCGKGGWRAAIGHVTVDHGTVDDGSSGGTMANQSQEDSYHATEADYCSDLWRDGPAVTGVGGYGNEICWGNIAIYAVLAIGAILLITIIYKTVLSKKQGMAASVEDGLKQTADEGVELLKGGGRGRRRR